MISNSKIQTKAFYVPNNLDLEQFGSDAVYVGYLLDLIHCKWVFGKAVDGFVRLKWDYLAKPVPPRSLNRIRFRLEKDGVIEIERISVESKRSWGYRITEPHQRTKRVDLNDPTFVAKLRRVYTKPDSDPQQQMRSIQRHDRQQLLPVHRWLEAHLYDFDFDLPGAQELISNMEPTKTDCPWPVEQYQLRLFGACQRIANKDHFLHCDRYGRVHTPITCLKKQLRKCLTVDEQGLVGLDLANSQPLFLGLVARQYYRNPNAAKRLRDRKFNVMNPYHRRELRADDATRPDIEDFIELCESGEIYESFMRSGDDRNGIKKNFLQSLFVKPYWKSPISDRIKHLYPSIFKMMQSLKKRNHEHLAHLMQNVESIIFIDKICRRIMAERPKLPIVTIHDSILTIPTQAPFVKRVMLEVFADLGVQPTIKKDNYV